MGGRGGGDQGRKYRRETLQLMCHSGGVFTYSCVIFVNTNPLPSQSWGREQHFGMNQVVCFFLEGAAHKVFLLGTQGFAEKGFRDVFVCATPDPGRRMRVSGPLVGVVGRGITQQWW